MTINKKLWIIFVLIVIVPFILGLSPDSLLNTIGCRGEVPICNNFRFVFFSISILAAVYVIYANHSRGSRGNLWYALGLIFLIVDVLFVFTLYSLSNFGF